MYLTTCKALDSVRFTLPDGGLINFKIIRTGRDKVYCGIDAPANVKIENVKEPRTPGAVEVEVE